MELPPALRRWTALTRVIDPGVPSNRFALFVTVLGALIGAAATSLSDGDTGVLSGAIAVGLGAFLGWAITRELDPDHTRTARYAGFGAIGIGALLGGPDVAALGAVLLGVRVVTRSTGLRPTVPDLLAMVVVAWLSAGEATGFVAALGMAAALVWDTRLPNRAPSSSGLAGAIVLSTGVVAAVVGGGLFSTWDAPGIGAAVVFLAAMAAAARVRVDHVRSRTDVTDEVLHPERVHRARVLTGIVLAGTMIWAGGASVPALGGAWAAFIAIGAVAWRGHRLAAATAALALLAGACSADDPAASPPATAERATTDPTRTLSPTPAPSSTPAPSPSPTPEPPPEVRSHDTAEGLAADLVAAERGIRDASLPSSHREAWAHVQQAGYRELAERPDWHDAVAGIIPDDLRRPFTLNAEAQAELHRLTRPRDTLPAHWTIVAPPSADELRRAYATAADEFGVDWTYLAAIHLTETRMGRIRGDSSAGARGPMQFMPATWDAYGEGDIEDPTDAIRAAARYLVAHGAPERMHAALWAYNHSDRYVTAVSNYAEVMQAEPDTYEAYHAWRVYYRLTSGSVVLDEGWSGAG